MQELTKPAMGLGAGFAADPRCSTDLTRARYDTVGRLSDEVQGGPAAVG